MYREEGSYQSRKYPVEFRELDVVRCLCKRSLFEFTKEFWPIVSAQTPHWGWHIRYICAEMQKMAFRVFNNEPNPYDYVINVPPGFTKSTICSEMFPAWVWTHMPVAQFICGSHTYKIAHDLARRCKDIIMSDKYQRTFGGVGKVRLGTQSTDMFINESNGFRLAVGAGSVTGFHGHFILVDDPIDPQSTKSVADRESAVQWMSETLSTRKVDKIVTPTVLIQQRLSKEDPSGLMLGQIRDKDWGTPVKHICLPWRLGPGLIVRPKRLRKKYKKYGGKHRLLDRVRLPLKQGEAFRKRLGKLGFSCQFEQNPIPAEGGLIKVEKFRYENHPPIDLDHFKVLIRFWDKAGTHLAGKRTAGVLLGIDNRNRVWILDVILGQWSAGDREEIIKNAAGRDGEEVHIGVEQEPGSGGKESAENTVKNLMGYVCTIHLPTGDKAARADPFAVQADIGNVFIPKGAKWIAEYVEELRYFPEGSFSDQTDATSGAFNKAMEDLGFNMGALFKDVDDERQDAREEEEDEEDESMLAESPYD